MHSSGDAPSSGLKHATRQLAFLTEQELLAVRSVSCKCSWVGREVPPKASAAASMFAFRRPSATVQDVWSLNATIKHSRSIAAGPVTTRRVDHMSMTFASMSDAGGASSTTKELDSLQEAWLVVTVDGAHISMNREDQSAFVAKSQAQEESVKRVCGRNSCLESSRGAGGVAAGDEHHGQRRDGARQVQLAVSVHGIGSTGLPAGASNFSKLHRPHKVSVQRAAQRLGGLSARPKPHGQLAKTNKAQDLCATSNSSLVMVSVLPSRATSLRRVVVVLLPNVVEWLTTVHGWESGRWCA